MTRTDDASSEGGVGDETHARLRRGAPLNAWFVSLDSLGTARESPLEAWATEALGALRLHGVSRFEELPEVDQRILHRLAGKVWSSLTKIDDKLGTALQELSTDALVAASSEELRRELEPELGISQEDRLQLQTYNRAQELVEELHGLSGHLRERTLLVPMPTTARNRKDWRY